MHRKLAVLLLMLSGMLIGGKELPVFVQAAPLPGFISDGEEADVPVPTASEFPFPTETPGSNSGEENDFVISGNRLVSYQGGESKVVIPKTVKTIASGAFSNNLNIKAVIVPDTVKKVERTAFYSCPYLRYVQFEGDTSMQTYAIYKCVRFANIAAGKNTAPYKYAEKNEIPVVTTKKPKLIYQKLTLLAGDNKVNILCNSYEKIQWKSSKKKVLTVSSAGKMKAQKPGSAVVTAILDGVSYSCKVTIVKRTVHNRVVQVTKSIITKKMSRYQKIKAVHNWMIANVKYDYNAYQSRLVPPLSHSARGALLKGVAVCDGYAHGFEQFMKYLSIPCKFVVGRSGNVGHGWNMVKLGGKWYHIDVTFDDPIVNGSDENTKPYYQFFLKSTKVMQKSHKWKKSKYPKCKSRKYDT